MNNSSKTACLVMARGGSKNPVRKNVLPVGGIPCVQRAIQSVQQFCDFPVFLLTDDAEIKSIGLHARAHVIDEPAELASDNAQVRHALRYGCEQIKSMGIQLEGVVFIEGNTVLFDPSVIRREAELFFEMKPDSVIAVATLPFWFRLGEVIRNNVDKSLDLPCVTSSLVGNRQEKAWRDTECFWHGPVLLNPLNLHTASNSAWQYLGSQIMGVQVKQFSAVHIDSQEDLDLANALVAYEKSR